MWGHCHGRGPRPAPFVDDGPAGGPLREPERVTRDQSVNDKTQSNVMGVKERVADGGVTRRGGGAAETERNDSGRISLYSNARF